jgi:hypothetical protein
MSAFRIYYKYHLAIKPGSFFFGLDIESQKDHKVTGQHFSIYRKFMKSSICFRSILDYNTQHEECRKGEIFLLNLPCSEGLGQLIIGELSTLTITHRAGKKAYDSDGSRLPNSVPIFVKTWEFYTRKIFRFALLSMLLIKL